jgi:hypothetical protein
VAEHAPAKLQVTGPGPAKAGHYLRYEFPFGNTVFPPTTVRFTLMFMI